MIAVLVLLPACGLVDRVIHRKPQTSVVSADLPADRLSLPAPLGSAQSAAALDQTTAAEKTAATAGPAAGAARDLGKAVVALGSPADQGFWIRTALVKEAGNGRVVTMSGASVNVDLRPGTGAALLSLAAFRALGLS